MNLLSLFFSTHTYYTYISLFHALICQSVSSLLLPTTASANIRNYNRCHICVQKTVVYEDIIWAYILIYPHNKRLIVQMRPHFPHMWKMLWNYIANFQKLQGVQNILCIFPRIFSILPPLPRQNWALIGRWEKRRDCILSLRLKISRSKFVVEGWVEVDGEDSRCFLEYPVSGSECGPPPPPRFACFCSSSWFVCGPLHLTTLLT